MASAVLIYNEKSGFHLTNKGAAKDVVRWLGEGGVDVTVLEGRIDKQIRASLKSEADIVIVDGGDGTIRAVIEAHRGHGRPIGIIPGGTMNLLANDYGVPEDREAAAEAIARGHTEDVDVGVIGGRVFLHTAFTGLPVRIGVHRERRRGSLSLIRKAALAIHALTTLPRDPILTLQGKAPDGGEIDLECPSFAVVVGTLDEQLLPRPHRASVTGGVLTLFALYPDSGVDVARLVVRGAIGDLAADEDVDQMALRSGTLRGPRRRMRAMLDGEATLIGSPAEIEVEVGGITIFKPSPTSGKTPQSEPNSEAA